MRPVTQTHGYVDDAHRGNCVAACIASIFELPLTAVPRKDDSTKLHAWLCRRYPGVTVLKRLWQEPHPEYPYEFVPVFKDEPPFNLGYWIATVESPRFTTACPRCEGSGEAVVYLDEWREGIQPEERDRRFVACFVCAGTGRVRGLHAVVMRGTRLEWDPSPQREMGIGRYHGETLFMVENPALLARGS